MTTTTERNWRPTHGETNRAVAQQEDRLAMGVQAADSIQMQAEGLQ